MDENLADARRVSREANVKPEGLPFLLAAEERLALISDVELAALEAQSAQAPEDGVLHLWLGLALRERKRWAEAIEAFGRAIELGVTHWRLGWYIAQAAKSAGLIEVVDQACAAVLKANPKFWFARELPKHARGYYSQIGQDKVVEQYFAKFPPRTKIFVEVGGFDGVHYSNVRRLHEKHGWTGVSFEPVSKNYRKLCTSYAGTTVKCVNAAVSTADSEMEINVSTYPHLPDWGSDVATLGEADTTRWEKEFGATWTKEKVPVRRLTRLLDEAGIYDFDFISIDTEGHDLEVLKSLDFKRYHPQLIAIEYGENKAAIAAILQQHGYRILQDNGMDFIAASRVRAPQPPMPREHVPSSGEQVIASFFAHQTPRHRTFVEVGGGPSSVRVLCESHGWSGMCIGATDRSWSATGRVRYVEPGGLSQLPRSEIDLLSITDAALALEHLNVADLTKLTPQVVAVAYGSQRVAVLTLLAELGYSPLADDKRQLIAARFAPMEQGEGQLALETRNFTGLSGKPAYNEIEEEFQQNLHGWLDAEPNDIERVVIVGGCYGLEVAKFLARYPKAEVHVFEPSQRHYPKLQGKYAGEARVHCHRLAVSDRTGTATFHEGSMLGVGSLLSPCDKSDKDAWVPFEAQEKFEVELVTLDGFVPLAGKTIDLLWCDVQGAELQVLRGGRETLTRCRAIFLEVANTKLTYRGQCRFPELDRCCDEAGFYLAGVGLCPSGNGTGNAAWLRRPATVQASVKSTEQGLRVVPEDELPALTKKLQPHLLRLKYLPLDREVQLGEIDPLELLTPQRFDLTAKYLYAKHRELGVDAPFARELYHEHIRAFSGGTCVEGDGSKTSIDDYFRAFDRLLDGIKQNGFDASQTIVPVARDNVLIDGAHRAAACLLHKQPVTVAQFDRTDERFGFEFFRKRGLGEAACDAMTLEYCRLKPDTFVATVFPSAVGKDEELRDIFNRYGRIIYSKAVSLGRRGAWNLIREIYAGEPWAGTWKNGFAGIQGKMEPCFRGEGPVRVFVFRASSLDEVKAAKMEIRALFGIANHSVHINDTHAQAVQLARLLLNANSIHFLERAQPQAFPRFVRHLEKYRQWLVTNGYDMERFAIDGSGVMAAYGLRDAQDLDVLHFGEADFRAVMPEVNSHNPDAHHHVFGRDDIVFNPAHHFYAYGVKFAGLHVLRAMKAKRDEGKDRRDVELIDKCAGGSPAERRLSYEFTTEWFKTHEPHWERLLKPWAAGRGPLRILEVGSFEGRNSCWMLDHLMSDRRSRLTCVDPWPAQSSVRVFTEDMEGAHQRFLRNVAASGRASQVEVRREHSRVALPSMSDASFDLIYLDGDHGAEAVAEDTRQALRLLKPGGLLLWDDYYWADAVKTGVDRACAEAGIRVEEFGKNASYRKPGPATATASELKIVGLIPARNEAARLPFCLRALKPYVDAIVYLDDCSDDGSVKLVESLASECKVERIIAKTVWHRDEPGDRNALLNAGREIGGTHFIVIDADEAFTANCARDDYLRRLVLSLRPGDSLVLNWIQLWRSLKQYRFDHSQWTYSAKAFAFCDDGRAAYQSGFIHTLRVPQGLKGKAVPVVNYVHGLMHFQFVDWPNLQIKQAWYRCMERVRQPNRTVAEINAQYGKTEDETGLQVRDVPADWFDGYAALDVSALSARDERRVREVFGWFREKGVAHFAGLDIWRVDWAALTNDAALAAEIRGQGAGKTAAKPSALTPLARQHMAAATQSLGRGDLKGCRAAMEQALAEAPEHPDILCALGNILLMTGNAAEAVKRFDESLKVEPNQAKAWALLAAAQRKLNNAAGTLTALQRALELDANCLEALRVLAEIHTERGRHREAVGAYRKIAHVAPRDVRAAVQLGRALAGAGEVADAEKEFRRALQLDANNRAAREALAQLTTQTTAQAEPAVAAP